MKKFLSISLSFLILATTIHLSIAEHFCGGKETNVKVSFLGNLANCGMEHSGLESSRTNLIMHCCDDIVIPCKISDYYEPAFSFVTKTFQQNFHVFNAPTAISLQSYIQLIPSYTNVSSPGELMSTYVDLSRICVFRI